MTDLLVAIGLVFAIEGVLYAAAPATMKRLLQTVLETPDHPLRMAGLVMLAAGVALVWLVRG